MVSERIMLIVLRLLVKDVGLLLLGVENIGTLLVKCRKWTCALPLSLAKGRFLLIVSKYSNR